MGRRLKIFLLVFVVSFACSSLFGDSSRPIVIYGDTRAGHAAHRKVVQAIIEVDPVAVFHVGDLVTDGRDPEQWRIFNDITSVLTESVDFYPALGNHEENSQLFFDNFVLPGNERWYSVEINGIHFIVLDSNQDVEKDSEQYQWLESDLRTISDEVEFVVVLFHHSPFTVGEHDNDEAGLRDTFVRLFEEYGVDVVFTGHSHAYERFFYNDIYYIVTGGGGAPFHRKTRESPHLQAYIVKHHFCRMRRVDDGLLVEALDADLNSIDSSVVSPKRSLEKKPVEVLYGN